MQSLLCRFFAVCLITLLFVSGHAFGSEDDREHLVTRSADNKPLPHDTGRVVS